jgi:hypothetical protein
MAYVIANIATKAIIAPRQGGEFTLVFGERGARKFSQKDRAEKAMKSVIAFFGNELPWEVIDTKDIVSRV